jgi:hypothetical protein
VPSLGILGLLSAMKASSLSLCASAHHSQADAQLGYPTMPLHLSFGSPFRALAASSLEA